MLEDLVLWVRICSEAFRWKEIFSPTGHFFFFKCQTSSLSLKSFLPTWKQGYGRYLLYALVHVRLTRWFDIMQELQSFFYLVPEAETTGRFAPQQTRTCRTEVSHDFMTTRAGWEDPVWCQCEVRGAARRRFLPVSSEGQQDSGFGWEHDEGHSHSGAAKERKSPFVTHPLDKM